MSNENDPLLLSKPQHGRTHSSGYYFLNKSDPSYQGVGTTSAVNDTDAGPVIEGPPIDSNPSEFAPRLLHKSNNTINRSNVNNTITAFTVNTKPWWDVFGVSKVSSSNVATTTSQRDVMSYNTSINNNNPKRLLNKTRKAPVKIEPKVFFSNERTFIAWMHVSIILAGGSIAILAFADSNSTTSNPFSQLYGIILLPVAISFIIYSMYQYQRRSKMIRTRHPGPYEDTVGPTVLGIMLMVSITAQFALKLYSMHYM
jgi:uncharacterized membrane protein YidH (DUF202 family)